MSSNQYIEYWKQLNFKNSWKDSLKYSRLINNYTDVNKNKLTFEQLNSYYHSITCEYMRNLKQRNIYFKDDYKFVRIWNTFINSVKKCKNKDNLLKLSNELEYVSFKNNYT